MISFRVPQITAIRFIIVSRRYNPTAPFFPPTEFQNRNLDFMRQCPKDLLQLGNALSYFELSTRELLYTPYHLNLVYSEDLANHLEPITEPTVRLYFVDYNIDNLGDTVELLRQNNSILNYYHYYNIEGSVPSTFFPGQEVEHPDDFVRFLFNNQIAIFSELGLDAHKLYQDIAIDYKKMFGFPLFRPAQNNLFILNTIIGNFCYRPKWQSGTDGPTNAELNIERVKSVIEQHKFERQKLIVEELKKIDFFTLVCHKEGLIKQVQKIDPYLPPLIVIAPFQNPDLKKIVKQSSNDTPPEFREAFISSLEFEQTENYVNNLQISSKFQQYSHQNLIKVKTRYLDAAAFLHGSNYFSPVVRLPFRGKSIYKNLSYFRTEAMAVMSSSKNRRNIKKTIDKFAKLLSSQVLCPELTARLKKHNRQVMAISDLPMEWLDIDGIPMAFTHDVCRLPETPIQGLMASYVHNERLRYEVPEDIAKKTLVIYGCEEPAFKAWQKQVDGLAGIHGFQTRLCLKLQDVFDAVHELKPDLLIFDCHGGVDMNSRSTYLQIGREKLTGDIIVSKQIAAPLVFLSACNTAPNYGTINSVANAFFETGAFSVTVTYLPININTGSILYLRMLNNLGYAAKNPIHKNWLAFIAHVIRTSAIEDAYSFILKSRHPSVELAEVAASLATSYTTALSFQERRKLYTEMDGILHHLSGKHQHLFNNIIPEYLFYSNLGRSDLILFKSWRKAYHDNNMR